VGRPEQADYIYSPKYFIQVTVSMVAEDEPINSGGKQEVMDLILLTNIQGKAQ